MAVTASVGIESSYSAAAPIVRFLDDAIELIDPMDTPLLTAVGLNSYDREITHYRVEWMEDEHIPVESTIAEDLDATETAVDVADAAYHQLGDIIEVGSELMWVVGIDTTNDTLHVVRGYAGTTAATHSNGDSYRIIGNARIEGSAPGVARRTSTTQPYNVTQIFSEVVEITGTEEAINHYGIDDVLNYRMEKRMAELKQKMELALLYGQRYLPSDNSEARTAGGLAYFITDTDDWGAGDILFTDVETALENVWQRVSAQYMPDTLVLNSTSKKSLTAEFIYKGSPTTAQYRPETYPRETRIGGGVIERLETDFGTVGMMLDRLVKTAASGGTPQDVFLVNLDLIQIGPMAGRAFHEIDATIPGTDHIRRRVLGEYTFIIKHEKAMVRLYT